MLKRAGFFFLFIIFNIIIISCNYEDDDNTIYESYVIFPNEGETLIQGNIYTIKWLDNFSSTVRIKLIISADSIINISNDAPNSGHYEWIVPDTLKADNCTIKILSNNSNFVYFESEKKFKIIEGCELSSFIDSRDGHEYKTIKINDQWWMAENFNYNATGAFCYLNDNSNCNEFGRLYLIEDAKSLAPEGWHLPSDYEWRKMEEYLGIVKADLFSMGSRGINLKELLCSEDGIGFNAKFSGYFYLRYNRYYSINESTYFWTSSYDYTDSNNWVRFLNTNTNGIVREKVKASSYAYSVRYIKDSE